MSISQLHQLTIDHTNVNVSSSFINCQQSTANSSSNSISSLNLNSISKPNLNSASISNSNFDTPDLNLPHSFSVLLAASILEFPLADISIVNSHSKYNSNDGPKTDSFSSLPVSQLIIERMKVLLVELELPLIEMECPKDIALEKLVKNVFQNWQDVLKPEIDPVLRGLTGINMGSCMCNFLLVVSNYLGESWFIFFLWLCQWFNYLGESGLVVSIKVLICMVVPFVSLLFCVTIF